MELNFTNVTAIIIIILFVGSLASTMFIGGDRNINNDVDTNTDANTTQDYEEYIATVDGNVLQIFPQLIISATPTTYDQSEIENVLKNNKNINEVNINFNKDQNQNITLISNITYKEDTKEETLDYISNLEILENLEIYQYGLLEIPKEITFQKSNDKNTTIDYYFASGKIEGIVNNDTLKEDEVQLQALGVFNLDELYRINVIELQNISSAPKMLSDTKTYPLESWNDLYLIDANTNILNNIDSNNLLDYNYTQNIQYNGTLEYSVLDLNQNIVNDLNNCISAQEISIIDNINIDENKMILSFKMEDLNTSSYNTFKDYLLIDCNAQENRIINEPKQDIYFEINEEEIDIEHIESIMNTNNLTINNIKRSADLVINDLNIEGTIYTYDQNITQTNLNYLKNKDKKEIDVEVSAYASRDQILYLMVMESEIIEQ